MVPAERALIEEAWATPPEGTTFDAWEAAMVARNVVLSVRETAVGFTDTPAILNAAWGFDLADIVVQKLHAGGQLR